MEEIKPSPSAIFAAMSRASHLVLDNEPKILRDSLSIRFCGLPDEAALVSDLGKYFNEMAKKTGKEYAAGFKQSYRAVTVVRQRFVEDELEKAIQRGVSQYVILGAGLDSFAYRQPDLVSRLKIFEVDHPETQLWKVNQLSKLKIEIPGNLTFVPVDFEVQNLLDELGSADCRLDIPVFFSMVAVTHLINEKSVFQTLKDISSAAAGSEIVFTYVLADSLLTGADRLFVAGGKNQPEPWQSQFDPLVLMKRLEEMGFTDISDFGPDEAFSRYLSGRKDELSPSALIQLSPSILRIEHIMKARIGV